MAEKKVVLPNISNWTPSAFVDELGEMAAKRNEADKIEKYLKEGLKARLEGQRICTGEKYTLNIGRVTQTKLDGDSVKALVEYCNEITSGESLPLGIKSRLEQLLSSVFKTIEFDQMKFARVQGVNANESTTSSK